jgi:hypothetical protein
MWRRVLIFRFEDFPLVDAKRSEVFSPQVQQASLEVDQDSKMDSM